MSSFVTEVLSSTGKLEKDDLTAKISKLSNHVDLVKLQVQETLESRYITFFPSLNETLELSNKVGALSNEVQSVTDRIENEIKTRLHSSTGEIQDLFKQLQESKIMLEVLGKILNIKDKLELSSQQLAKKDYNSATLILEDIIALISEYSSPCQNQIKIFQALKNEYIIRREKLKYDLGEIWNEHIVFTFDTNREEHTNSSQLKICIPGPEKIEEITNFFNAMQNLKYLDHKLKLFANVFMNHVCIPLLKSSGQVKQRLESQCVILEVTVLANEKKIPPLPSEVFTNFKIIFDFLNKTIMQIIIKENDAEVKLMRKWGALISKDFCDALIKHCLSPAVPCHKNDLHKFNKIIEETSDFQKMLIEYGFFSEEEESILAYAQNVDVLFVNKMCQGLLEKARNLMMQDLHITYDIQVSSDPMSKLLTEKTNKVKPINLEKGSLPSENKLSDNTFKFPACKISESTRQLVSMAYEILNEATSAPLCSVRMFYTVRKLFELYYDVVPVFHQENLERLPQQSALHHNNCMYIAHHLLTMGHQFHSNFPEPLKDNFTTFMDLVPLFQKSGSEVLLAQMRIQKKILLDIIREIGGFHNMASEPNFMENLERELKQCLHQLSLLQRVWQDVLPTNVYSKAIGTLLNSLLEEIISQITIQEDIPSDCTVQLIAAFGILTSKAPALFKIDNKTNTSADDVHCYAPKWMKFKELILVLGANMKDILDRWANGKGPLAHEFSVNEVKQLIRALFQNTDRRALVLTKIK